MKRVDKVMQNDEVMNKLIDTDTMIGGKPSRQST